MLSLPRRIVRAVVVSSFLLLAASIAYAGVFPGPQEPAVFSGDFGILLADDMADPTSAVASLGTIAGDPFPWDGGFVFPASLPPVPAGSAPPDLPPVASGRGGGGGLAPVPEPSAAVLLGLGLVGLGYAGRRRSV